MYEFIEILAIHTLNSALKDNHMNGQAKKFNFAVSGKKGPFYPIVHLKKLA